MAGLPDAARARAERLFEVDLRHAVTDPPPQMNPWLTQHFGSVDAVRHQTLIRVTDRISLATATFAPLRAARPIDGIAAAPNLAAEIAATEGDPFCDPTASTPADRFGRVRGAHSMTGANAAAGESHHGVIVFERHDPLAFDTALIGDVLRVGREWATAAGADDPAARNYLLIWNCTWRAGGSIVHGHAQVLLGAGRHHGAVERLVRDAARYRELTGGSYLDDLVAAHRNLGLAEERGGVTVLASLTPAKERELWIVGPAGADEREAPFRDVIADTLIAYRDALGVRAFNMALLRPPLGADAAPAWRELRPIVRLVDRGDPQSRASDIGAIELLAGTTLVGCDPYETIASIRAGLGV